MPICPRLHDLLLTAYDAAQEGQVTVAGLSGNNLTRNGQKHLKAAGLTTWQKLYQALRTSCENDWKSRSVAEATYATWMGHSPTVSRKGYVAPLDTEYEVITGFQDEVTTR